jgi:hypothetical protein
MDTQKVTRCYFRQNVRREDIARKCSKTPVVSDRRFTANFCGSDLARLDRSRTNSFLNVGLLTF